MAISASLVKELRERTGSGMMDCKRALDASGGDLDAAIEAMRASGQAKAIKKSGRVAAEGVIVIRATEGKVAMIEVNCETDFVARDGTFVSFVGAVAETALSTEAAEVDALLQNDVDGASLEVMRQNIVGKLGENIQVRRVATISSSYTVAHYLHGEKIGVIVEIEGGDQDLAKDIAMHIAASKPEVVAPKDVDEERQAKEKAFLIDQAKESGKPEAIIEKMIVGRMKKFLNEISLLGQDFIKNPDVTVAQLLKEKQAKAIRFVRYEVGEGIEKKVEDFAKEVMEQVKGS
jgi:elongation factor Ts